MRVGDLQLRILRLLWEEADLTVRDVHGRLGGEGKWAYDAQENGGAEVSFASVGGTEVYL